MILCGLYFGTEVMMKMNSAYNCIVQIIMLLVVAIECMRCVYWIM